MKEFLINNWFYIVVVVLSVVEFIFFLLSKKKVYLENGVLAQIYTRAIGLIQDAESKFKKGSDKLDYVVNALIEYFPDTSEYLDKSFTLLKGCGNAKDFFTHIVEEILSTPEKKVKK